MSLLIHQNGICWAWWSHISLSFIYSLCPRQIVFHYGFEYIKDCFKYYPGNKIKKEIETLSTDSMDTLVSFSFLGLWSYSASVELDYFVEIEALGYINKCPHRFLNLICFTSVFYDIFRMEATSTWIVIIYKY